MSGKIRQLVPFSLVIAAVVCLSSGDGYQSQTKLPHRQERTEPSSDNLIIHVDLVNVMFTVTDRKGKLVTDLARQNLKVHEDSKPQAISNFARETELPLTIAVRIDTSSSIRDRFKLEQEAAIDFV